MRLCVVLVGLVLSFPSWAEITVGVNSLSVVHKSSNGVTIVFPDVCKTPTPGGPVPIPYPNIAQSSDASQESKRTKKPAPAIASADNAAKYALDVKTGGKVHIRQTAGRDSVTTATYVDADGDKLQLREPALIKLANGDLCAICAAKDGRVTAVYRLLPEVRQRKAPSVRD